MEMANNEAAVNETESMPVLPAKIKKPRGFAAMSAEKRKAISALGGKRAHELGVAHTYTSEEAKAAGHLGGAAPHVIRGRSKATTE